MSPLHLDLAALTTYLRTHLPNAVTSTDPEELAARESAVLVPIFAGPDGTPHLLFTVRAQTLSRHRGEISFPGGRRDPEDETLVATALREASEEIGLAPWRVEVVGALPPVFTVVSNYLICPFVGIIEGTLEEIAPLINVAEVDALISAPLAALADPTIAHTEEWMRLGQSHTVYFFQHGEHRIWGATARILANFLALLVEVV